MLKCRSEKKNTFEKNRLSSFTHARTQNNIPTIEHAIKANQTKMPNSNDFITNSSA